MNMNYNPSYQYGNVPVQPDPTIARLQQLEAMQRQYQQQYQQPAQTAQNVNWIPVTGLEGAKNQIVQPGQTAWMMSNNEQIFFVKSVDGMGSATLKAFRFQEVPPDMLTAPQTGANVSGKDYVTRAEFDALLAKLGEPVSNQEKGETLK